jgi:2-C-methyl-D-erythritol 2,4-cyclodiphosphate synthase
MRVGIGYDVHRFSTDESRPMIVGGVRFEGVAGLDGHSDADVVAHSIADAMLGAASLGDLGAHFSDADEQWRGADSLTLLAQVAEMVGREGLALVNADCTVVGERPRIAEARLEMMRALSTAARGPVHVKATRPEGLGALGRKEGLACMAVVLLGEVE